MGVAISDVCQLSVSKTDILNGIQRAQKNELTDNLRQRHPNVKFDSIVRGYIGEVAFRNWLNRFDVKPKSANQFDPKTQMDIDFSFELSSKIITAELKTSLIPDADHTMANVLLNRDIKLIKRGNTSVKQLGHDLHIQLVFKQRSKTKDQWLTEQNLDLYGNDLEELYYKLAAYRYITDVYFVGWITKAALEQFHYPTEKTWSFKNSKRIFWKCSLSELAYKPMDLIAYLKS